MTAFGAGARQSIVGIPRPHQKRIEQTARREIISRRGAARAADPRRCSGLRRASRQYQPSGGCTCGSPPSRSLEPEAARIAGACRLETSDARSLRRAAIARVCRGRSALAPPTRLPDRIASCHRSSKNVDITARSRAPRRRSAGRPLAQEFFPELALRAAAAQAPLPEGSRVLPAALASSSRSLFAEAVARAWTTAAQLTAR
jgi:hypothetical protein